LEGRLVALRYHGCFETFGAEGDIDHDCSH
jgi:hypothetical protein